MQSIQKTVFDTTGLTYSTGIGPKMAGRLSLRGIKSIGNLASFLIDQLVHHFGKNTGN